MGGWCTMTASPQEEATPGELAGEDAESAQPSALALRRGGGSLAEVGDDAAGWRGRGAGNAAGGREQDHSETVTMADARASPDDREFHLQRVLEKLPRKISAARAARLAGLLGTEPEK